VKGTDVFRAIGREVIACIRTDDLSATKHAAIQIAGRCHTICVRQIELARNIIPPLDAKLYFPASDSALFEVQRKKENRWKRTVS
jgi:hypothetical protein